MTFVLEKISEEDKGVIKLDEIRKLVRVRTLLPDAWAADKERGFYLFFIRGASSEDTLYCVYGFLFKGTIIKVHAYEKRLRSGSKGVDVKWLIEAVYVPETLKKYRKDIYQLLKEAFLAYEDGMLERVLSVKSVSIEFIGEL